VQSFLNSAAPPIEVVDRRQAAPPLECLAKGRFLVDPFSTIASGKGFFVRNGFTSAR
jgi:hypothetical protein